MELLAHLHIGQPDCIFPSSRPSLAHSGPNNPRGYINNWHLVRLHGKDEQAKSSHVVSSRDADAEVALLQARTLFYQSRRHQLAADFATQSVPGYARDRLDR
jgi:hypothetical protein